MDIMRRIIFTNLLKKDTRHIVIINKYSNTTLDIQKLEADTDSLQVMDDEAKSREEELEKKRNKSRLNSAHFNIIHGKPPYSKPLHSSHITLRFKRKMYGKFGSESGVDPGLCWPTKEELTEAIEYEKIAHPLTIPEMIAITKKERLQKEEGIRKRQEDISKNLLKMDVWMKELNEKIAKKEAEATAAKERKEKLIEEVRRHFGYTVDPRDDRFKEMLEKKEKEQKKAMKEARRKVKEEKMISKILTKNQDEKGKNIIDQDKVDNIDNVKE